jgi:hypothetical protein
MVLAMPVEAVMMDMPMMVMMMAHPGIGVQHAGPYMHGLDLNMLDSGCMPGGDVAACESGRGQNGDCKQRRGNCFEHGGLLLKGITRWAVGWPVSSIMGRP